MPADPLVFWFCVGEFALLGATVAAIAYISFSKRGLE